MDNKELFKTLFGPLSGQYCDYFLILSMLGFAFLVVLLLLALVVGISKGKGFDFYLQVLSIALMYALLYFENRLLNGMCKSSLA
tara:strand:+ start:7277 stop:7528 length:252 start_codon:yes stop_codon:yes gene_type:complete